MIWALVSLKSKKKLFFYDLLFIIFLFYYYFKFIYYYFPRKRQIVGWMMQTWHETFRAILNHWTIKPMWSCCYLGSMPLEYWKKNIYFFYIVLEIKFLWGSSFKIKNLVVLETLDDILSVFTNSSKFW